MAKLIVTVEKTNTGFSAGADKYPVYTAGDSLEEIKENITNALNLYFKHNKKILISEDAVKLKFDIPSFFEFYKVINAKALSERIGMNQSLLAQYSKGIKQPSEQQTKRILHGVQKLGKELAAINF
ncbi:MAG: hypothetical protein ABIW38_03025 [Ferruginibacter sp.]